LVDELLECFDAAGVENGEGQRCPLEECDRDDLFGLVADLLLHRLKNDMRDIESGHRITIGLCVGQLLPAKGSAPSDLVVYDHLLFEKLIQVRLLETGYSVGLPARVKADHVVYLPGRKCLLSKCTGVKNEDAKQTEKQRSKRKPFTHALPPCRDFHEAMGGFAFLLLLHPK
jgi:hypothetical protein